MATTYTIQVPGGTMVSLNAARGTYPGITVGTYMRVQNYSNDDCIIKQASSSPAATMVDFDLLKGIYSPIGSELYIEAGSLESWIYCPTGAVTISVRAV